MRQIRTIEQLNKMGMPSPYVQPIMGKASVNSVLIRILLTEISGMPWTDIISRNRVRKVVLIRQYGIYRFWLQFNKNESQYARNYMTLKDIGKLFGGRNHATVLNAVNTIEDLIHTKHAPALDVHSQFTDRILSLNDKGLLVGTNQHNNEN